MFDQINLALEDFQKHSKCNQPHTSNLMSIDHRVWLVNLPFPFCLSAATQQEELKKKTSTLSETKQQLEKAEKERVTLQASLDKLSQEGPKRQAELDKKVQGLSADLKKAQEEKEALTKEMATVKEALSKASKALKENQTQLEAEKKSSKATSEEKVRSLAPKNIWILVYVQKKISYYDIKII